MQTLLYKNFYLTIDKNYNGSYCTYISNENDSIRIKNTYYGYDKNEIINKLKSITNNIVKGV